MNGPARSAHSAREHLSRLVVVLAVLAGLALVVGAQCTDGMSMAHGADAVMAEGGHEVVERPVAAAARVALERDTPGDSDMGGVLAACLMIVAAVIAVAAVLRLAGVRGSAAASRPGRVALVVAVVPRAPSLARLCLLRI